MVGESISLYTIPRLLADEIDAHDAVIRMPTGENWQPTNTFQAPMKGAYNASDGASRVEHRCSLRMYAGNRTTWQVYAQTGKEDWTIALGTHGWCSVYTDTPLLLWPFDNYNSTLPAAKKINRECIRYYKVRAQNISEEAARTIEDVHRTVTLAAGTSPELVPLNEEWIAVYTALARCEYVAPRKAPLSLAYSPLSHGRLACAAMWMRMASCTRLTAHTGPKATRHGLCLWRATGLPLSDHWAWWTTRGRRSRWR